MIKRTVKTHHDIFVSKKDESQCHHDVNIEIIVSKEYSYLCGDDCKHLEWDRNGRYHCKHFEWDLRNGRYHCFLFNDVIHHRDFENYTSIYRCKTCKELTGDL